MSTDGTYQKIEQAPRIISRDLSGRSTRGIPLYRQYFHARLRVRNQRDPQTAKQVINDVNNNSKNPYELRVPAAIKRCAGDRDQYQFTQQQTLITLNHAKI